MTEFNVIENAHEKSSHRHWCAVEAHYYHCAEDCVCICGLPMNGNDHSECPVELRECQEHELQQEQQMPEEALPEGVVEIKFPADWRHTAQPSCGCGCAKLDTAEVVGWCLHCAHVYADYSPEIQDRHFARCCPGVPAGVKQEALESLARRARKRGQGCKW